MPLPPFSFLLKSLAAIVSVVRRIHLCIRLFGVFFFLNSSSRSLITQIRCLFLVWLVVVETMVVLPKIVPNTFPWQTDDAYFGVNYVVANDFPHPTPKVGMLSQAQKNLNLD